MIAAAKWYLLVTLLGWVAWPLGFRHLRILPDRGFLSSRALGLLLVGYTFWILASLGLVANTPGAMLLALLIVGGASLWQHQTRPNQDETLHAWLREHWRLVLVVEALFLVAFVGWTLVRAHDPALNTTEKPMELTFLNGIRQSSIFPPRDPWLAGFAISYYYFGYVMVAMLADLTGVASAIAFNLAIPMLFALSLIGAFGLLYNLIALRRHRDEPEDSRHIPAIVPALLGPLFVAIMGNLEGALELLRALRIPSVDNFWAWLDVAELNAPIQPELLWPLDKWRGWWWWRASRVVHDRDLAGVPIGLQPIDEFPMFSFLLGDMHPHVLALPFALLVLGLALNLAASQATNRRPLTPTGFVFFSLVVGSLAFLNAWDLPIYLFIVAGAETLRQMRRVGRPSLEALGWSLAFGLGVLVTAITLYLPFYIGFRSQAGGILPNVIFPTRLPNFVVMFGPLLFVVIWFLARETAPWRQKHAHWWTGILLAAGVLAALIGLMALAGTLALREQPAQDFLLSSADFDVSTLPPDSAARDDALGQAIQLAIERRIAQPGVALLLTALLAVSASRFLRRRNDDNQEEGPPDFQVSNFVILLTGTGALLTLGPEFVYLQDIFNQRLNTVFKFYYAAWVLWGIAAAYAVWAISRDRRSPLAVRGTFIALATVLVGAGLVYPVLAIPSKADFGAEPTLDGIAYIQNLSPGDMGGIRWLQTNAEPDAIVLEAIGGQYSFYGRVSTTTGLQTLLGWPGHELQWRGSLEDAGSREADTQTIYRTPDMRTALELLDQYNVTYVFVGSLEQEFGTPAGLEKFERFLTPVYENGDTTIYSAEQPLTVETE